ncbi:hypothetical protein BV22DRAFT_309355 [Leucogyrophana mollusca]|uniref:Uncharacterized protein n=1 Tax=Leucogyrophana mollusca TaxID=85980 RepID=A0ACB8BQZ4_9AGAM|nr:hypothetical protein BV22DRAFT_309355 [Leucogyrophana mollusca]
MRHLVIACCEAYMHTWMILPAYQSQRHVIVLVVIPGCVGRYQSNGSSYASRSSLRVPEPLMISYNTNFAQKSLQPAFMGKSTRSSSGRLSHKHSPRGHCGIHARGDRSDDVKQRSSEVIGPTKLPTARARRRDHRSPTVTGLVVSHTRRLLSYMRTTADLAQR